MCLFLFILQGCGNSNNLDTKERELDLREKELLLKEKELLLKEKEKSISETAKEVKPNSEVKNQDIPKGLSDVDNLLGEWFMIHSAMTRIYFYRDGSFIYKGDIEKDVSNNGTYKLENGKITLLFNSMPKKTMKLFQVKGDNQYYIKDGVYQYVKADS